jgi:hypothetical protein
VQKGSHSMPYCLMLGAACSRRPCNSGLHGVVAAATPHPHSPLLEGTQAASALRDRRQVANGGHCGPTYHAQSPGAGGGGVGDANDTQAQVPTRHQLRSAR